MIKKISERLFSKQFLNLLMIKMLIPAMATGGMSIEVGAINQLQSAYVNSITSVEVSVGELAEVYGNNIDPNMEIMTSGYRSNIAGDLSTMISFKKSSLLTGTHMIYFTEQNDPGDWLQPEVKLPDLTFT